MIYSVGAAALNTRFVVGSDFVGAFQVGFRSNLTGTTLSGDTVLPPITGFSSSAPSDVNESGVVVGTSFFAGSDGIATLWKDG